MSIYIYIYIYLFIACNLLWATHLNPVPINLQRERERAYLATSSDVSL